MGFAALYGMGTRVLADTSDPSRWYGVKVGVEVMPGAVLLIVLPTTLLPSMGISGVIWGMIGMSVLLSFALITMPEDDAAPSDEASMSQPELRRVLEAPFQGRTWPVWIICMHLYLFRRCFSHLEFSRAHGSLGRSLHRRNWERLSSYIAIRDPWLILTGWLGSRFQNINPFLISVLILIASLVLLADFAGPGQYATAACIFLLPSVWACRLLWQRLPAGILMAGLSS